MALVEFPRKDQPGGFSRSLALLDIGVREVPRVRVKVPAIYLLREWLRTPCSRDHGRVLAADLLAHTSLGW